MARVSEDNDRYRTKAEMVRDVAYVLSSPLTIGTRFAVLKNVCWAWTEFDGKYRGCPYWSKAAIKRRRKDPKAKLKHEHAVPRKVVIDSLLKMNQPTMEQVKDVLERLLIGVVVTPEEADLLDRKFRDKMPEEFSKQQDAFLRYDLCGIEYVENPTDDVTQRRANSRRKRGQ